MKKFLSIFGVTGLIVTASTSVVACENKNKTELEEKILSLKEVVNKYSRIIENDIKDEGSKLEAQLYLMYFSLKLLDIPENERLKWTNLAIKAIDATMLPILIANNDSGLIDTKKFGLMTMISRGYLTLFDEDGITKDTTKLEHSLILAEEELAKEKNDIDYESDKEILKIAIDEFKLS